MPAVQHVDNRRLGRMEFSSVVHGMYVICCTFRDFKTIRVLRFPRVCYNICSDERVSYSVLERYM
jgi:hypothetical protein